MMTRKKCITVVLHCQTFKSYTYIIFLVISFLTGGQLPVIVSSLVVFCVPLYQLVYRELVHRLAHWEGIVFLPFKHIEKTSSAITIAGNLTQIESKCFFK